jgi:hypothetical protein
MKRFIAILVLCVFPLMCGCDMGDQAVLNGFQKYFPAASLLKFDQRILWVQTDVNNISRDFATEVFQNFVSKPEAQQLGIAMPAFGYQVMVLGFSDFVVIWTPAARQFLVLDLSEADDWSQSALGYRFSDKRGTAQPVQPATVSDPLGRCGYLQRKSESNKPLTREQTQYLRGCQQTLP